MNKFLTRSFLGMLLLCMLMSQISFGMSLRYAPNITISFSGHTAYCTGASATPNTLKYGQCSTGTGTPAGTLCTAQWYYNTTGDTIAATSVPLGSSFSFASAAAATGTLSYTPITTTAGTFFYFVRMTMSSAACNTLFTSMPQMVTVGNAPPSPISGPDVICVGITKAFSDAMGGGTWSSGATTIATVNSGSGAVLGLAVGLAEITYTTGCGSVTYTTSISANPSITGVSTICAGGSALMLSATPAGGTWSSSAPLRATVDASGDVNGLTRGTSIITYTLPSGCLTTQSVVVDTLPMPLVGGSRVCVGQYLALDEEITGGTWSTSNSAIAYFSPGTVFGQSVGQADISYSNGCGVTVKSISVNPLPTPSITYDPVTNSLVTATSYANYQWYTGTTFATATPISGAVTYRLLSPVGGQPYIVNVTSSDSCLGHSAVFNNPVGVINTDLKKVARIYPNPVSGIVYISSDVALNVVLTDMTGKKVISQSNAKEIDIHHLLQGMYIIMLYDEDDNLIQRQAISKIDQ